MATLSGTLFLDRAVLSTVTEDANETPVTVVSGTAATIQVSSSGQTKIDETTQTGSFRQYGNGNTRLILGAGSTRTQTLALVALNPDQVESVRGMLGHTVCYRNTWGQRIFGAFIDMQVSYLPGSGKFETGSLLANVGVVIQSVTHDEAV